MSEINLAARHFMISLAGILKTGAILLIDYGFGHDEYYHPQRNRGTLMCHYRHYAHDDPFYLPGLQDITSHGLAPLQKLRAKRAWICWAIPVRRIFLSTAT